MEWIDLNDFIGRLNLNLDRVYKVVNCLQQLFLALQKEIICWFQNTVTYDV
jgi:hypothetical protein